MLAGISLGSNMGDRLGIIRQAILLLKGKCIAVTSVSDVFETAPWGHRDQPWFLNACLLAETTDHPGDLLLKLQSIENELGKTTRYKWGPREIDLDLLFMDNLTINEEKLVIPHPEMHHRAFVLVPLNQVAPDWVHPLLRRKVKELVTQVTIDDVVRITNL